MTGKRAAIYPRVSGTKQEEGYSLETQDEACRRYAAERGYDVTAVYREVHTGIELWERPQLTAHSRPVADTTPAWCCVPCGRFSEVSNWSERNRS